jgi:hypothetical protein
MYIMYSCKRESNRIDREFESNRSAGGRAASAIRGVRGAHGGIASHGAAPSGRRRDAARRTKRSELLSPVTACCCACWQLPLLQDQVDVVVCVQADWVAQQLYILCSSRLCCSAAAARQPLLRPAALLQAWSAWSDGPHNHASCQLQHAHRGRYHRGHATGAY